MHRKQYDAITQNKPNKLKIQVWSPLITFGLGTERAILKVIYK